MDRLRVERRRRIRRRRLRVEVENTEYGRELRDKELGGGMYPMCDGRSGK